MPGLSDFVGDVDKWFRRRNRKLWVPGSSPDQIMVVVKITQIETNMSIQMVFCTDQNTVVLVYRFCLLNPVDNLNAK